MKIARRTLLGMAGAAALLTGAFASTAALADITIGMTVSQTGRFALAAQSGERGFKIWIDDVNARGGIDIGGKKHKIKLETLDDRSDKALVPRVYETLIKDKKVDHPDGAVRLHPDGRRRQHHRELRQVPGDLVGVLRQDLRAGPQIRGLGDADRGLAPRQAGRRRHGRHGREEGRHHLSGRALPRRHGRGRQEAGRRRSAWKSSCSRSSPRAPRTSRS